MLLAVLFSFGVGGLAVGQDEQPQACTRAGCESIVSVQLRRLPQKTARVRVCTQDRCGRAYRVEGLHGRSYYGVWIAVLGSERRDGRVVRLRIRVFNKAGKLLRHRKGRAKLRRYQPNGPDCPPTCYQARLEYRGDTGRLNVQP